MSNVSEPQVTNGLPVLKRAFSFLASVSESYIWIQDCSSFLFYYQIPTLFSGLLSKSSVWQTNLSLWNSNFSSSASTLWSTWIYCEMCQLGDNSLIPLVEPRTFPRSHDAHVFSGKALSQHVSLHNVSDHGNQPLLFICVHQCCFLAPQSPESVHGLVPPNPPRVFMGLQVVLSASWFPNLT